MKTPNQLIHSTSPYLLQHAYNPVNWYPWSECAIAKAVEEHKPILISIGYSACHWCHVMERESFEDEMTAAFMNEHFINIKIDREERPDLDHLYMDAVQAMTGSGGWPLNVFLTPDKKPFYGGTYFPPSPMHNRASWRQVLENVRLLFHEKQEAVQAQANKLLAHLQAANQFGFQQPASSTLDNYFQETSLQMVANQLLANADKDWGGFGSAPKFPQSFSIQYLLRHYHFTKDENALQQALLSLDKMIFGGIYDHLGGGFARYSTDQQWLVPHFEKMLYDNALLVSVLAEAYQITQLPHYAHCIRETMGFLQRELQAENQGFYCALDADSEGEEGKYYTWTRAEIASILGEDTELFCKYYQVEPTGNWEGVNILWVKQTIEEFASQHELNLHLTREHIHRSKCKLLSFREKRIHPGLDNKILLGWNALLCSAATKAYAALGDQEYQTLAILQMEFLENHLQVEGVWFHSYQAGIASIPAFVDDYAYLIQAYIQLQEITGNTAYLIKAKKLSHEVIDNFEEAETGFFFYTHQAENEVIVRKKEIYDGAVPSGNSVMAANLQYLGKVFDDPSWKLRTKQVLASLEQAITKYPGSFGNWAMVLQQEIKGSVEIVIAGELAMENLPSVLRKYCVNKIILVKGEFDEGIPMLKGKLGGEGNQTKYFLCKNEVCEEPMEKILQLFAKM